jgi:hypothetical protein
MSLTPAQQATLKQIQEALENGYDMALELQAEIAQKYEGWKPHRHAAAARDVAQIKEAIEALAQLEAQAAPSEIICEKCGVDRGKDFCPRERLQACGFAGVAHKVPARTGSVDYGASVNAPYLDAERSSALSKPVQAAPDALAKVREALDTYYCQLVASHSPSLQADTIYAIEQAVGMGFISWCERTAAEALPPEPHQ